MIRVPRVSIVIAAYNVAPYLSDCIESLLGQTEESIELILVDDGSTDETPNLADSYASADSRVTVIHRLNGGLSVARNTGLHAAKGEFVCFVDGDDWAEPNMVESMISSCEKSASDAAIAGVSVDFHNHNDQLIRSERRLLPLHLIRRGIPLDPDIYDESFVNLLGYAWNKIYRREWLLGLGVQFEEGLSLIEDIDFNAKVLSAAERVALVPGTFIHYVQRPRETLGSTHDESYLTLRLRSIDSVDLLLESWGVDQATRMERSAMACNMALWMALRSAAKDSHPRVQLQRMLEQPSVKALISNSKGASLADWRGRWVRFAFRHQWYGAALFSVQMGSGIKRFVSGLSGRASS